MSEIIRYHLFWDHSDEWFADGGLAEEEYHALGDIAKRLYEERYASEEAYENDQVSNEECLLANGEYPA